ncbi:hypothetical protein PAXRUDRAFT_824237 [Paxillus rubicundulus Ve08.2h10]|uniref:Uncharacterized protein n=1 Tax=Paxillus rubicundulus Ve08.2h10 TaxID=930991 RepID=A0A0D0DIF1_9AGAM|nr:hypothetical protein PAXRUDRAFT_824237 [Paxillus rubicundulus Ve08.2h10]
MNGMVPGSCITQSTLWGCHGHRDVFVQRDPPLPSHGHPPWGSTRETNDSNITATNLH